ncbi:hypothetical protein M7I_2694 [Glarea lozoyensis 74030]|uniref:Uncharacterized protein n=1 Tax=Glarea lozoyensis (strain ATCC 74030 / MF5533) TaxID=1104152 RepID=H0EJG8_GLAL7|nr:hypothetical protein M7I_2694 [Glarea lozoyensis 74030]
MPKSVVRAPAVPARSEKRASKLLKELMMDLENMEVPKEKEMDKKSVVEDDPHELYLSSEEEGSLSDDYADSLLDFEPLEDGEVTEERAQSSRASTTFLCRRTTVVENWIYILSSICLSFQTTTTPAFTIKALPKLPPSIIGLLNDCTLPNLFLYIYNLSTNP